MSVYVHVMLVVQAVSSGMLLDVIYRVSLHDILNQHSVRVHTK